MDIEKEYEKLAIKSLKEDMNKWEVKSNGCMDLSWTWYQSPIYKNNDYTIEFHLDANKIVNTSLDVLIRGRGSENLSLMLNPFSELYTLLCTMKKYIANQNLSERDKTLINAIRKA